MRTIWRRLCRLENLVARVVRRDLAKRRLSTADAALPAAGESGCGRVAFEAPLPFRSRELPARAVPLRSPREHAQELLQRALDLLGEHGVPVAEFTVHTAAGRTLGVRQADWTRAAALLMDGLDHVVLGTGTASAGTATYAQRASPAVVGSRNILHLLAPAATHLDGRLLKRYGFETAVRLERWDPTDDGRYAATTWNPRATLLGEDAFDTGAVRRPGSETEDPAATNGDRPASLQHLGSVGEYPRAPLRETPLMTVDFPIDVVYTWVDGTDPAWLAHKREAAEAYSGERMTENAAADLRFVAHDELRHSLRSLEQYAPWVNHVYLVTDRQRPAWLREDHPRLTVVDHTEIAPEGTTLPSFNSQAIEANLHRIDGLSEHFLYFNDDVFLSSPVGPELFFNPNGIASMYLSKAHVAPGAPELGEPASDSAGKNARTLVREVSGRRVSRKLFHTPFPLRRSVSAEIEQRWPEVVRTTRNAQFRQIDDITLSGALHMNYAYATARAVTRGVRYRYVNVGAADSAARLDGLVRDRDVLQTFCLNEATADLPADVIDRQVRDFLHRRFPDSSSFEIAGVA